MCILLGRWWGWLGACPTPTKDAHAIVNTLQHFVGRQGTCDFLCFDNAKGYIAAARKLNIKFETRTANRRQSNGVAETDVRTVLAGTRSVLYASGLQHNYWSEAAYFVVFLRNIDFKARDTNKTAYQMHHSKQFNGKKSHLDPWSDTYRHQTRRKQIMINSTQELDSAS